MHPTWQTIAVSFKGFGHRRRTVLLGGLTCAVSLSGCTVNGNAEAPAVLTDALVPILATARNLMTSYEAAMQSLPDQSDSLKTLHDNHQKHVAALAKILGESPDEPGKKVEGDLGSSSALKTLGGSEKKARDEALDACVAATPEFAVLLGEICACRASHAEVLGLL